MGSAHDRLRVGVWGNTVLAGFVCAGAWAARSSWLSGVGGCSAERFGAQEATLHGGGMDLHLFRPAVDTRGYFTVNGTEVMPHKEFSFGLVLDAGFGILRYNGFDNNPNGAADTAGRESRIAKQAFTGTFMFNFGLIDRLVIGIQLPITFFRGNSVQTPDRGGSCLAGSSTCLYNLQANGLRSQGVGDLTIHVKARLLNLGEEPGRHCGDVACGFPHRQDDAVRG